MPPAQVAASSPTTASPYCTHGKSHMLQNIMLAEPLTLIQATQSRLLTVACVLSWPTAIHDKSRLFTFISTVAHVNSCLLTLGCFFSHPFMFLHVTVHSQYLTFVHIYSQPVAFARIYSRSFTKLTVTRVPSRPLTLRGVFHDKPRFIMYAHINICSL